VSRGKEVESVAKKDKDKGKDKRSGKDKREDR
jgi:hypothetical protein